MENLGKAFEQLSRTVIEMTRNSNQCVESVSTQKFNSVHIENEEFRPRRSAIVTTEE